MIAAHVLVEHARLQVLGQVNDAELIQGGAEGRDLLQHFVASTIPLNHPLQPRYLSTYSREPLLRVYLECSLHISLNSVLQGSICRSQEQK